jgi:hypothetical protein
MTEPNFEAVNEITYENFATNEPIVEHLKLGKKRKSKKSKGGSKSKKPSTGGISSKMKKMPSFAKSIPRKASKEESEESEEEVKPSKKREHNSEPESESESESESEPEVQVTRRPSMPKDALAKSGLGQYNFFLQNSMLILPAVTFALFNFLSTDFFSGKIIKSAEVIYVILTLAIPFFFSIKNMCGGDSIISSLSYSMFIVLIINTIMAMNPCGSYLSLNQNNAFYLLLLVIGFNALSMYMKMNRDKVCKSSDDRTKMLVLIALHASIIYFGKF